MLACYSRRVRRALGVGFVLFLLVVAAGCGGSGDESSSDEADTAAEAASWADSFCTSIADWRDALEQIGSEIASDPTSISRDTLEQGANDARDATEQLIDDLRELGAPDTEAGQAAEDAIEELGDTLEQELDEARAAVEDASGIGGVLSAVPTVMASFTAAGDAIESTLDEVRDLDAGGELEDALRDSDVCQELSGENG